MTRNQRKAMATLPIGTPLRRASVLQKIPTNLCPDSLFCYEFTNEFDQNSLRLETISLYVVDPLKPDTEEIDLTFGPPFEPAAEAAAMAALRQAATNSTVIFGRFSLAAPNPPPPQLRYRANGTIGLKVSIRLGLCIKVEV